MRDLRIKKVRKGDFRSRLSVEDITPGQFDTLYAVTNKYGNTEKILVMHLTPLPSPLMQYLFYTKVKKTTDKYLKRFVYELTYLNQGIDSAGIKKMITFILQAFVLWDKKKKQYAISYEELEPIVKKFIIEADTNVPEIYGDKTVLFERNTLLKAKERQKISTDTRAFRNEYLKAEIIHNKAIQIVSRQDPFAIGKKDVHEEVKTEKGLKTYKSFVTHTVSKTVKILEDTLELRKFRTQKEAEQFEVYKVYREKEMTTAEMVKKMKVSYGTLSFFSRVLKEKL